MSEKPLNEYIDLEAYDVVTGQQYRDLLEQKEALEEAIRNFADLWPGDSYDWQYIQDWSKRTLKGRTK